MTTSAQREALFTVAWHDVGTVALEGRPGIVKVDKTMQGRHEANRVIYNADDVSLEELETYLQQAGTYLKTALPTRRNRE